MKRSMKAGIAAAFALLLLAAFFLVAIGAALLDFGGQAAGGGAALRALGKMLVSVYGFCSVLVPAFLFAAGIFCFLGHWTARRAFRLLTAVVPFFTAVITENICRSILALDGDAFAAVKVGMTIAFGAMLVAIEFLGAGIIADKISGAKKSQSKLEFTKRKPKAKISKPKADDDDSLSVEVDSIDDENSIGDAQDEPSPDYIAQGDFQRLQKKPSPFENIFDKTKDEEKTESDEIENADETIDKTDEIEKVGETIEETVAQDDARADDAGMSAGGAVLTDEEYSALTSENLYDDGGAPAADENAPEEDETENESAEGDGAHEISWDNLPAASKAHDGDSLDPDFFDIDLNADDDEADGADGEAEPIMPEFSEPAEEKKTESANEEIENGAGEPSAEKSAAIPSASDVFARMDEDARRSVAAQDGGRALEEAQDAPRKIPEEISDERAAAVPAVENSMREIPDGDGVLKIFPAPAPRREKKPPLIKGPYKIPCDLLTEYADDEYWVIDSETQRASVMLKETLNEFNIEADVIGIKKGPVVTMFELLPAPGVKLSKIVALQDNIALRLAASSVRIVAPIPGKRAVGIEIPNKKRSIVGFREIIEQRLPEFKSMAVPVILGKDILGRPQIIDIVKTPHMLIAGATGAGKSVCVNSMILSILYKRSPQDVKLILIDPKIVELKLYNDIPHLLVPVITETKKALQALQWALCEMERRYAMLDGMGCREIASYNKKIIERHIAAERMPYIVIIIDEFADLMATSGKELESTVARLAAMSRAVGIHLVLATQRPSIDVITGLIKANIPSRIAFMVASKTDSRIIIDQVGAEKLLGKGDMLYASAVDPNPTRIQGTFVNEQEVEEVAAYVKKFGEPDYIDEEVFVSDDEDDAEPGLFDDGDDPLYDQALEIVMQAGKASASYIQRRLKIGYNRAARLVEEMERRGIVGPANGSKPRDVIHAV